MGKPIEIKVDIDTIDFINSLSSEEIIEMIKEAQKDVLEPKFDLQLLNGAIDAVIEDITEYGFKMSKDDVDTLLNQLDRLENAICKEIDITEMF